MRKNGWKRMTENGNTFTVSGNVFYAHAVAEQTIMETCEDSVVDSHLNMHEIWRFNKPPHDCNHKKLHTLFFAA